MIVTVDGCGKMIWKDQSCLLEKGSAVLIDCNVYQEYKTEPGKSWDFYWLHFNALSMDGYKNALLSGLTPVRLRAPGYAVQRMEEIYQNSHQSDILAYAEQNSAIGDLLTEMIRSLAGDRTTHAPLYRDDIADLAAYIRANCTKDLHIQDFTDHSNLSKHHLIRLFSRQTGMSPYQYLHMCRINRAQVLLRSTDMTVAQIADAVGYSDSVIFIRHFRAFHPVTPGEYRRESIIIQKEQ